MTISLYTKKLKLRNCGKSRHIERDRQNRLNAVLNIEHNNLKIDKCFLVDRGDKRGLKIHAISYQGIIYIYNLHKLLNNENALITMIIANKNQIARYYLACGLTPDKYIIDKASEHTKHQKQKRSNRGF